MRLCIALWQGGHHPKGEQGKGNPGGEGGRELRCPGDVAQQPGRKSLGERAQRAVALGTLKPRAPSHGCTAGTQCSSRGVQSRQTTNG